ncbi:MAG: hemerythrin family protein [Pseudomonadota bacterium]
MLIDWSSNKYLLGNPGMDATHAEFVALVNRLATAEGREFQTLFLELLDHTGEHFGAEEALMEESGFPAIAEHRAEHWRVLGELRALGQRVMQGRITLARSYVAEQIPSWFSVHAATMDSALAAHLAIRENTAHSACRKD